MIDVFTEILLTNDYRPLNLHNKTCTPRKNFSLHKISRGIKHVT